MKTTLERFFLQSAVLCFAVLLTPPIVQAQQDTGEVLFKQVCIACHTINRGKLIGPDLANVQNRRPMEWVIPFVKSSQSVIKGGDAYAIALFEEFNNMVMPDNNFTDAQIMSIISYIAAIGPGGSVGMAGAAAETSREITPDDVRDGAMLFNGQARFASGGPACSSCHNVKRDDLLSGGALAKDLTDAYTRLSAAGVKAIIANPPFPAMKKAFEGRALTDDELFGVVAFLQKADSESASQQERWYGARLFLSSLAGAAFLMGVFGGFWRRTKKRSVNHAIYERQVRSTWEVTDDSKRIG